MKTENLLTGSSSLYHKAGWMIKVLAGDPYEFKRAMKEIRNLLYKDIERKPTDFRRY
jgi:hypothetical protein